MSEFIQAMVGGACLMLSATLDKPWYVTLILGLLGGFFLSGGLANPLVDMLRRWQQRRWYDKAIQKEKQELMVRGFIIGPRDPQLNTDFPGKFMVSQAYTEADLPTKGGSDGPWCIVGDDLNLLVDEAYEFWCEN